MTKKILITGTQRDAGKTTIACSILSFLNKNNISSCGFKPKAGNSFWYDFDIISETLKQGRLYGNDAKQLKKYSKTKIQEENISPIHRLWTEKITPRYGQGVPGFILDRITLDKKTLIIKNEDSFNKFSGNSLFDKIMNESEIKTVSNLKEYNKLIKKYYNKAIKTNHDKHIKNHDAIIYESYRDIALPWKNLSEVDLVLTVKPWIIYVYNGRRYLKSVEMNQKYNEVKTDTVTDFIKPIGKIEIPALTEDKVEKIQENKRYNRFLREISLD
ncbi:MAG: hypothetical protein V5A64_05295 [Candidatus Thermoplasmatota archaeon]